MASALAAEIENLLAGLATEVYGRFAQEDRDELSRYATHVAALALQLQGERDPDKRAAVVDNMRTYENAARLMLAKYEIIAASAMEKAAVSALHLALGTLVKIIVAVA